MLYKTKSTCRVGWVLCPLLIRNSLGVRFPVVTAMVSFLGACTFICLHKNTSKNQTGNTIILSALLSFPRDWQASKEKYPSWCGTGTLSSMPFLFLFLVLIVIAQFLSISKPCTGFCLYGSLVSNFGLYIYFKLATR